MSCLGCQRCEMESTHMVKLNSGEIVCSDCPDFLLECSARYWIDYAITRGKKSWKSKKEDLTKKRGESYVEKLVEKMNELRRN